MNKILQLDLTGLPNRWLSKENAVTAYAKNNVRWELGNQKLEVRGGINKAGIRSTLIIAPVIATDICRGKKNGKPPLLSNPLLFRRDSHLCLYCGRKFPHSKLTRDHVTPRVQGGKNTWVNVVTACQSCNHHKGGRTPDQAGMELLAIPFEPNPFEMMYLANRNIVADQMDYLRNRFSKHRQWPEAFAC